MPIWLPVVSKFDPKGVESAQKQLKKLGDNLALGVTAAFAGAAFAAVNFGKDAIVAAESVSTANARIGQIAESMDIFGTQTQAVTDRLIAYAKANEQTFAVDENVIKSTQAKLLTFKELAITADETGGAFDRATQAAIDLAAAGFGSAEQNAVQLGKALQDPIKGITALARSGVTFTEQEKEKIKTLVESGKMLEAQNLILQALETQVGGTAEATANASDKMALAFGNIYEEVGKALLPVLDELLPILTDLAEELGKNLAQAVKEIDWDALVKGVGDFTSFIIKNFDAIVEWGKNIAIGAAAFVALKTAIDLARVASILFAATPIGALIAALGLLGGAAFLAADAVQKQKESMTEADIAAQETAQRIAFLRMEQEKYNRMANNGSIEASYYAGKLEEVTAELALLQEAQVATQTPTLDLTTNFSDMNLTLDNAITKMEFMKNATGDAERELKLFNDQVFISKGGLDDNVLTLDNATTKMEFFRDGTSKAINEMQRFIDYAKRMKDAADKINSIRIPSVGQITYPGQSPIPMAEGGIVLPKPGGTLAQIGEAGQAEAVIPLDRLGNMGGNNYNITINAGVGSDPVAIGRYVTEAIKKYERVSGKVFANA